MPRVLLLLALSAASVWGAGELSNRRAPGFSLPDSVLKQHDLADYRGKWVLLEIMLTTCPHCQKFASILESVQRKYADRVQVLSIVNQPDNTTTVGQFIKKHGVSYPILFDCGQVAGSYMRASPQKPSFDIPHLFLIDPNGQIRNDFGYSVLTLGIFEGQDLSAEVDRLLAPPAAKKAPKK